MSFEIRLEDIRYRFGTATLFEKLNVTVPAGGELVITGKSGSGKSTLLEIVAGVIPPENGSVIWDGHGIAKAPRVVLSDLELRSSVVFQAHALISYLPLFENIALPLRYHHRGTRSEIDTKVSGLIDRLNLNRVAWHLPEALSVGEKRLGALARALVTNPELICMDEPTDGLDTDQKQLFIPLFEELVADSSVTIVVASNDSELLGRTGACLINLNNRVIG